jgi:hypothetical protein
MQKSGGVRLFLPHTSNPVPTECISTVHPNSSNLPLCAQHDSNMTARTTNGRADSCAAEADSASTSLEGGLLRLLRKFGGSAI